MWESPVGEEERNAYSAYYDYNGARTAAVFLGITLYA